MLSYCRTVALLSHPGHGRVSAELGPRRRSGSHRRRIPVAAVLSGGQVRAAWGLRGGNYGCIEMSRRVCAASRCSRSFSHRCSAQ